MIAKEEVGLKGERRKIALSELEQMEIQGQRATKAIYRNVFDKWVLLSSGIDREDKLDGA